MTPSKTRKNKERAGQTLVEGAISLGLTVFMGGLLIISGTVLYLREAMRTEIFVLARAQLYNNTDKCLIEKSSQNFLRADLRCHPFGTIHIRWSAPLGFTWNETIAL